MPKPDRPQQEPSSTRIHAALHELRRSTSRWSAKGDQLTTAIPGLSLFRREAPTPPMSYMYERSICLVAQGAKQVLLGDYVYVYDPRHFLITSVDLPVVCRVIKASREQPYLTLLLKLDQKEVSQLIADNNLPPPRTRQSSRGMAAGKVTLPLLNAFQRLIDLLDDPKDIPILAPIIQQEIVYRLLVGDQGTHLRQMALAGSQSQQIARAIYWLKSHFTEPLRIEELAGHVSMSPSTFHHHFRTLTARARCNIRNGYA